MDQLSCSGQNTEWPSAHGRGAGSCESRKDLPIGCRNDAVEDKVYGSWPRDRLRSQDLHLKPGAAFFWRHHGLNRRRNRGAADWVYIHRGGFSSEWFRRNRRLSVPCRSAHFADGASGRGIPFHCRRACPSRSAGWRVGNFPAPSVRGAAGLCPPGRATTLKSDSAKYPVFC